MEEISASMTAGEPATSAESPAPRAWGGRAGAGRTIMVAELAAEHGFSDVEPGAPV